MINIDLFNFHYTEFYSKILKLKNFFLQYAHGDENLNMSDMEKLKLRYSHNIIEHLGLKLYQNKPTNVIAELISNSWDADAQNV